MRRSILTATLTILVTIATAGWSQPPESPPFAHPDRSGFDPWSADRLAELVDYLELSEAQATQWRDLVDRHREERRTLRQQIDAWQEEFRALADEENPDLAHLGRISLDIHRAMQSLRASHDEITGEVESLLTAEQVEKFEALKAARDLGRHHRRQRPHRHPDGPAIDR